MHRVRGWAARSARHAASYPRAVALGRCASTWAGVRVPGALRTGGLDGNLTCAPTPTARAMHTALSCAFPFNERAMPDIVPHCQPATTWSRRCRQPLVPPGDAVGRREP